MSLEWGLISFGALFLSFFLLLAYFSEYREERKFERDNKRQPGDRRKITMAARRKRKGSATVIFLTIVVLFSLGTMGYSGLQLYTADLDSSESRKIYESLDVVKEETSFGLVYDFDELAKINPDVVAWIKLDDSTINYPVVHGNDNQYYLEHLFDGTVNHHGTVFVDTYNSPDFTDQNTAMYAHHMNDGTMFADLEKYKDPDWARTHSVIHLYTRDGEYEIHPFSGFKFSGTQQQIQLSFNEAQTFESYIEELKNKSQISLDTDVKPGDQIVTLSTCTYGSNWQYNNERFAIFGKLKKIKTTAY